MESVEIIFTVPGKYRSYSSVLIVSKEHVENKIVFKVQKDKAAMFVKAQKAEVPKKGKKSTSIKHEDKKAEDK